MTRKGLAVALLGLVAILLPTRSSADSLLTDSVDFVYLADGLAFGGGGWPGHEYDQVVVSGGAPEYDFFDIGVFQIDVDATSIRMFIPTSSIGFANFGGFTGVEISDLDWPDMPSGGHITGIGVTIVNPDKVTQGQGSPVPFAEELVTFGDDWVRIPTGGYNMFAGFEVVVDLETAPNDVPEPSTLALLGLGAGSLAAKRIRKARQGGRQPR